MEQLIITIEGKSNVDLIMRLMRQLNFVKSITRGALTSSVTTAGNVVSEPVEEYNWINPSRPATDEEFEQMISEAEAEVGIPAEEAKALTMKKIAEWKKLNRL
jgi:hypothetical protein